MVASFGKTDILGSARRDAVAGGGFVWKNDSDFAGERDLGGGGLGWQRVGVSSVIKVPLAWEFSPRMGAYDVEGELVRGSLGRVTATGRNLYLPPTIP
jgi:hypothetical protein